MNDEWKTWFLTNIEDKEFSKIENSYNNVKRKYEAYVFSVSDFPFHAQFTEFMYNYTNQCNFQIESYIISRYVTGCYFNTHVDSSRNRILVYSYELLESDCKTKLLVNNKPITEGWFDNKTEHCVPPVKKGTRISLTVFGKNIQTVI